MGTPYITRNMWSESKLFMYIFHFVLFNKLNQMYLLFIYSLTEKQLKTNPVKIAVVGRWSSFVWSSPDD